MFDNVPHGWDIVYARLPVDAKGFTDYKHQKIVLDPDLLPSETRCTLAHELEHARRGSLPADPVLAAREERRVEQAAARQLIEITALARAIAWSRWPSEIAEELGVDEAIA